MLAANTSATRSWSLLSANRSIETGIIASLTYSAWFLPSVEAINAPAGEIAITLDTSSVGSIAGRSLPIR